MKISSSNRRRSAVNEDLQKMGFT